MNGGGRSLPQTSEYTSLHLFGQLAYQGSLEDASPTQHQSHPGHLPSTGHINKLMEINAYTNSEGRVHRHSPRFHPSQGAFTGSQVPGHIGAHCPIIRPPLITERVCLRLLVHIAACTYVVQYARLHVRLLQMWLAMVYSPSRHHLDIVLMVSPINIFFPITVDETASCIERR